MFTDVADPVIGGAHECVHTTIDSSIEHIDDGLVFLEAYGLLAASLIAEVIDSKKLIVT